MTDPVDTDALRALASTYRAEHWAPWATIGDRDEWSQVEDAADEVDRLRAALVEAHAASDRYSQALSEHREQSVLNEGRLRAVIENAPHEAMCAATWRRPDGHVDPCTCWKVDV